MKTAAPLPLRRFDERLDYSGDWDLVLRLTDATVPLAIPFVAAYYATSTAGRLSDVRTDDEKELQFEIVRRSTEERKTAFLEADEPVEGMAAD